MLKFTQLLVTLSFLVSLASAHNQLLSPWSKSCFHEDVKKGDQLAVTFQVGDRDPNSSEQPTADFWVCRLSFLFLIPAMKIMTDT